MRVQNIDQNWQFGLGTINPFAVAMGANPDVMVNLPHDYMLENEVTPDAPSGAASGFYNAGVAHYKKIINIPADWENDRVFIRFDGVMMNATLEVNGGKAALQHNGYIPFCVDITPYIYFGQDNSLVVVVNPSMQPNSRWYSGAGIFRSVELIHTPAVHISNDGIYGYTRKISYRGDGQPETAFLNTEVTVANTTGEDHIALVEMALVEENTNKTVMTRQAKIQIDAGTKETAYIPMTVEEPKLWNVENPNLYRLHAVVTDLGIFKTHFIESNHKTVDEEDTLFGIRTVTSDVKNGLMINENTVKLKGGCIHHDNGLLGAVSLYDAEKRRISKMKEVGFNAIRTTHNPPSKVLMEVCDRLGMYVFAEAYDAWGIAKQPGDYNQFFEDDWEKDLAAFMVRDRNHPSIIIWSTGNEIPERGGLNHGYTLAVKLAKKAKELDQSRPISNGICSYWSGLDDMLTAENMEKMMQNFQEGAVTFQNADGGKADTSWEELSEPFTNGLDIVGYNYMEDKYPLDHKMYPERIILGSENYPKEIGKRWPMVENTPYVIGDFTWTAYDYIGEAGIGKSLFVEKDDPLLKMGSMGLMSHSSQFPYRLANDADIDINGIILPQGNYRSVVYGSKDTYVFSYNPSNEGKIELLSAWGFTDCRKTWNYSGQEGKETSVIVFSSADEVELLVNGVSVGKKKQGEALGVEELPLSFVFQVAYEPGEVVAISYDNGQEISRDTLATVGKATALKITTDQQEIAADGHSLVYATIEVTDEAGALVTDAEISLKASVTDGGSSIVRLAGFGSGNPITAESYVSGTFTTYQGRACAILKSGYETGEAVLHVEGDGVEKAEVKIVIR